MSDDRNLSLRQMRIPPHDLDAEKALLGSILIKPHSLNELAGTLSADDFYAEKHQHVFRAMDRLYERSEPIDMVSVSSILKEQNQMDRIGGSSYLAELVNFAPSASNMEHYAEIVSKKAALRRVINSTDQILNLAYTSQDKVDDVFDKVEAVVANLSNFTKKTYISLKDTLVEAWERFDRLHKNSGELRGVPTGFKDLDSKLSGLQNSDLIILAARPSMGKTALALDIARNAACKNGIPTLIFSLEMSSQQLADRIIASESKVDSWKLRTGKLTADEDFARIRDALDSLSKAPIYIDDESSNNISKMKSVARKIKAEMGLKLIIVDYLQLLTPKRDSESLVQQVTEISRSLKGLARELDVPVLALSQLSRAVEQRGGKPRLADLRDSGSIEQDADVVMFIHREQNEQGGGKNQQAEILIEKHRNGPTGSVNLYYDQDHVCFTSLEKSDFGAF